MKHIILLVFIVLTACAPRTTQEISQPNSEITLEELPGWKDVYDAMGAIDLVLRNNSDSRVSFASDFGADIYIKNGAKWEKLKNNYGYSAYDQVLPTASEYPGGLIVPVAPDLDGITNKPIVLRVNVKGTLSDSGKEVEAYLDITIE